MTDRAPTPFGRKWKRLSMVRTRLAPRHCSTCSKWRRRQATPAGSPRRCVHWALCLSSHGGLCLAASATRWQGVGLSLFANPRSVSRKVKRSEQLSVTIGMSWSHNAKSKAMFYDADHPDVSRSDWQTFHKQFSPYLFKEVLDRSEVELPERFAPLARGAAIAADYLLRKIGCRRGSHRPVGWKKLRRDIITKYPAGRTDCDLELVVRQYALHGCWTIERWGLGRKNGQPSEVLTFVFGSTPVICSKYQAAMHLAEYCHLHSPPSGLRWIASLPEDEGGAIAFARRRRADEAQGA